MDGPQRSRATLALAAVLFGWYAFQLAVFGRWPEALLRWTFTVESLSRPTPGWVLSTFSHGFRSPFTHLLPNVGMLLVFGGLAERHLRESEYVAFFVVVGSVASLVGVGLDPARAPVLGSSGAIYGLATFSTLHVVRHHADRLSFDGGDEPTLLRAAGRSTFTVLVLAVPLVVFGQVAGQLVGLLPSGGSAVVAHGVGALCGVGYEYLQSTLGRPCRERSTADRSE